MTDARVIRVMMANGIEPSAIVDERVRPAGHQGIDEHEPGDVGDLELDPGIDATCRRQDPEDHAEDVAKGEPEDEDRDAHAEERDDGDSTVRKALWPASREPTQGDPQAHGEQQRGQRELDRTREPHEELSEDRPIVHEAVAKVARRQLGEITEVLLR